MIEYPNYLNKIFDKLEKNGAKFIIVGGFIRDYFLNLEDTDSKKEFLSKDIDVEVYNIDSFELLEEILKEFGDVNSVGKSFGVCKLSYKGSTVDFTLPRIDKKIASGHTGFTIEFQSHLDFTHAARRRDFTMNAIGYDVLEKKIIDPFYGIEDLKNRVLKAVDATTFVEDPLRVLRGVAFCARFNLKMNQELFTLCKQMIQSNILQELPKERIFEEMKKLLLKAKKPSIGFELLKSLGTFSHFCEFDSLNQGFWQNLLRTVDELANQKIRDSKTSIVLMLAGICYRFDEVQTISFLLKLTNEKELLKRVLPLTQTKMQTTYDDFMLYRLATKVNIEEFVLLNKAIYKHSNSALYENCKKIKERSEELNILNKKTPALLKGKDILACGLMPSKEFSTILSLAYEAQMNGEFNTFEGAKVWLKNYLVS